MADRQLAAGNRQARRVKGGPVRRLTLLVLVVTGAALLAQCGTSPTTTPTQFSSAAPSGDLPADDQGPNGWQQVFVDQFDVSGRGTSNGGLPGGRWAGYPAGTVITNSTNGVYDASKTATVGDGKLSIWMWSDEQTAYGAAFTPIVDPQTYGRYDVRYRYATTDITGYRSAWLLWPDSQNWGDGEIDFAEYQRETPSPVSAAMHRACGTTPCPYDYADRSVDPLGWHTATAIWSPGEVRTFIDGHPLTVSKDEVPDKPMHLILQAEASSTGVRATPGDTVGIEVDWVSIYRRR